MSFLEPGNVGRLRNGNVFDSVKLWLEEAIFGHRPWARQTPWLLFLEFLNVAEAHHRRGRLLAPTEPDQVDPHTLRYRNGLRHVLFNNQALSAIAEMRFDDDNLWRQWQDTMPAKDAPAEGFGYLRERFGRFDDFAKLVALVRQTTLEASTNRRWSSRFVFPFGVDAIYSDAIYKANGPERDYNNFGRTGELLYQMLARSAHAYDLRERLVRLLDPEQPKNRLVALLNAPSDENATLSQKGDSFLPYRRHPAFDRLAEDWICVLDLALPAQDAYAHLAPLATLHVLLYLLETAAGVLGAPRPVLVCEIIAPRRELVRQRSLASFNDNDALARQAASIHLAAFFDGPEWRAATDEEMAEADRVEAALALLKARFSFRPQPSVATVDDLVRQFRQTADDKHDDNWGDLHVSFGRYVGLVSRRGTNRNRYAPTDDLLRTLVVARVRRRTELGKFLSDLHLHYGLVFGPVEAGSSLPPAAFDASTFSRNRDRLEARLRGMGLLKRLSDGCAYVINPFAGKER